MKKTKPQVSVTRAWKGEKPLHKSNRDSEIHMIIYLSDYKTKQHEDEDVEAQDYEIMCSPEQTVEVLLSFHFTESRSHHHIIF